MKLQHFLLYLTNLLLISCHLALGEIGEAMKHFKKCLQADMDVSSDRKYLVEASDGLRKAQVVHPISLHISFLICSFIKTASSFLHEWS